MNTDNVFSIRQHTAHRCIQGSTPYMVHSSSKSFMTSVRTCAGGTLSQYTCNSAALLAPQAIPTCPATDTAAPTASPGQMSRWVAGTAPATGCCRRCCYCCHQHAPHAALLPPCRATAPVAVADRHIRIHKCYHFQPMQQYAVFIPASCASRQHSWGVPGMYPTCQLMGRKLYRQPSLISGGRDMHLAFLLIPVPRRYTTRSISGVTTASLLNTWVGSQAQEAPCASHPPSLSKGPHLQADGQEAVHSIEAVHQALVLARRP